MNNATTERGPREVREWCANAVLKALADADRTKKSLSDETGIPYPTLNRKLAAKTEFSMTELLALADALHVHPSTFTPPLFRRTPEQVAA
ncbi:helix-turn-helix domain-containing protein [Pseudoclavibacter alba]|uniref:Helix-turn-helix domain-containing protein n=1 Tax=Pseudoclavibacter albus TaxID=272241 RepID=A0ABT2HWY8_9MICO|nr:helix-turn-helix transcriptional regulator [Pseudoclavibacter alba]MCT2042646.1 helix-turn-helix domain-containing protein [Pseudoclavibacter alba]